MGAKPTRLPKGGQGSQEGAGKPYTNCLLSPTNMKEAYNTQGRITWPQYCPGYITYMYPSSSGTQNREAAPEADSTELVPRLDWQSREALLVLADQLRDEVDARDSRELWPQLASSDSPSSARNIRASHTCISSHGTAHFSWFRGFGVHYTFQPEL